MKGYLAELNAHVAEHRAQDDAVKQAQAARRTSLDERLKHLLGTIPPEVQAAGLSIVELQVMLRPPAVIALAVTPASWVTRCAGLGSCASGAGMTAGQASVRSGASASSGCIEHAEKSGQKFFATKLFAARSPCLTVECT